MTDWDLQQYKYRRNFPYNDTIKEDSDENLSENRSTRTLNSIHQKGLLQQVLLRQASPSGNGRSEVLFDQTLVSSVEVGPNADAFFQRKSEQLIRNFTDADAHDEVIEVRDLETDFGRQSSEKYIKTSRKELAVQPHLPGLASSITPQKASFVERKDTFELDDEFMFDASQRNSAELGIEPKRLSECASRGSGPSKTFPDSDFYSFRRKKAEYFVFDWFVKAYFDKQISAFYLIWDNVQYAKLRDLVEVVERKRAHHQRLFWAGLREMLTRPAPRKKGFVLRSKLVGGKLRRRLKLRDAQSKFKFSSFDAKYKSFRKPVDLDTPKLTRRPRTGNLRRLLKKDKAASLSLIENPVGFFKTQEKKTSQGQAKCDKPVRTMTQSKTRKKLTSTSKRPAPQTRMRSLRKALEKEQIQKFSVKAPKSKFAKKPFARPRASGSLQKRFVRQSSGKESKTRHFASRNGSRSLGPRELSLGFGKRKSRVRDTLSIDQQAESTQLDPAIARVFFLLSKRFRDSKYKTFFMDQIEVLVYRHGIRDPQILNILRGLDLRFGVDQLCPAESETDDVNSDANLHEHQRRLQKKIEKQCTRDNIRNLEKTMTIFRADALFAPLLRATARQLLSHTRHFFINLRRRAKLAPFRRIHSTVAHLVQNRLRKAFSQILFYVQPKLRLLPLIFAISKVKQKRLVDSFRRIHGFGKAVVGEESAKRVDKVGLMQGFIAHLKSQKNIKGVLQSESPGESDGVCFNQVPGPRIELGDLQESSGHDSPATTQSPAKQMTKIINWNLSEQDVPKTRFQKKKDSHFEYYDSSLDTSKKHSKQENSFKKEPPRKNFFEDNGIILNPANPFGRNPKSTFKKNAENAPQFLNLSHLKAPLNNLHKKISKLAHKNQNWAFIKLREHYACSMFELEVIEAEDCTQEMDDMVGNVHMMETGQGHSTGLNRHLAREKSHIFEEANKYISQIQRYHTQMSSRDQSMFDQSAILPADSSMFMRRQTSMGSFGFDRARASRLQNTSQLGMVSGQSARRQTGIRQGSPQIFLSPDPARNNSMFLHSAINLAPHSKSGNFIPNQGNNQQPPQQLGTFKRRPTIRESVLKQFNKLSTLREAKNQSILLNKSKSKKSEVQSFNIYSQTDLSNLDANRVNI